MLGPNLASRPFVNARPVWLLTAAAGLIAVVMCGLLAISHLRGNRTLAVQIAELEGLEQRRRDVAAELSAEAARLEGVPWRSLAARINSTNDILRERAFSWLQMLEDIEQVLPYEVRIVRIAPKIEGERVNLGLVAICRTREALLDFLDRMVADPRFDELEPRVEVQPTGSGSAAYELTLRVTYLPGEADS